MVRRIIVFVVLVAAAPLAGAQILAPTPAPALEALGDLTQALTQDVTRLTIYDGQSWLGVGLADLTSASVASLHVDSVNGAEVVEVYPDSPAAKAGVQAQDVITHFNGDRVTSVRELERLVSETPAERTVPVTVMRNGKPLDLQVQLGARAARGGRALTFKFATPPAPPAPPRLPPQPAMPAFPEMTPAPVARPLTKRLFAIESGFGSLGISFQALTPQLADYFGLKSGQSGLLVASVEANSPGAKAGVAAGDVLTRFDGADIGNMGEFRRAVASSAGGSVAATVIRHGKEISVKVEIPPRVQSWQ